ncbi:hypothetical protein [Nonomuraea sp. NPDC049400]|uniref:hypothetical protein n=1 Tax=Nonomuraea sp. NPDC049400 TaxID=3364352 RepID=UPI0037B834A1
MRAAACRSPCASPPRTGLTLDGAEHNAVTIAFSASYRALAQRNNGVPRASDFGRFACRAQYAVQQCPAVLVGERAERMRAALIHTASRGYPRAINNLAIQALLATFIADKTIVDESAARAAVNEVIATE